VTGDLDLKELLEFAAEDEPPPEAGPANVFRRADAIRHRHRVVTGLAGVATLGVLVAAGVTIVNLSGRAPSGNGEIGVPAAPGTTASAAASAGPESPVTILRALLPAGVQAGSEVSRKEFAQLVVTDLGGRTLVEVNVEPDFVASAGKITQAELLSRYDCAKRAVPTGAHCSAQTLPDGTRIVSVAGPAGEPGAPDVARRQVELLTPAGGRVVVTASNAVNPQKGPVTRPEPGLDLGQLRQIAASGRWWTGRDSPAPTRPSAGNAGGGR
jgi:hypothetical protein